MKKIVALALLAITLSGCATVPVATAISLGTLGVAAGALAVNAYHDCRADGGCKQPGLPK